MTNVIAELKRTSFTRENHIPYHYPERPTCNADMAELYEGGCEIPVASLLSRLLAVNQSGSPKPSNARLFILEKRYR